MKTSGLGLAGNQVLSDAEPEATPAPEAPEAQSRPCNIQQQR